MTRQDHNAANAANYDPNRLLDDLLRRLNLTGDEALADILNIGRHFLRSIRRGELKPGAALLIRINEKCGIEVHELRAMLGDRRAQYRLGESGMARVVAMPAPGALATRESRTRNDAGLPNTVQWA